MTDHRGSYILERGVWKVTCKACGWQVSAPVRRQAASLFRVHITDIQLIDLTAPAAPAPSVLAESNAG